MSPYDPSLYNFFPMIPLFINASISRAEALWLDQNLSQLRLRELLLHDDGNGEELVFLHDSLRFNPRRQLLAAEGKRFCRKTGHWPNQFYTALKFDQFIQGFLIYVLHCNLKVMPS